MPPHSCNQHGDDVIPTHIRSDRYLLALSLAFFALAGVSNTALDVSLQSAVAMTISVAGVYGLARYAQTVSRAHLARLSFGLWIAFLVITPLHVVALPDGIGPLSATMIALAVQATTWATLLGAGGSTAFLGFREYNAQVGVDSPEEDVLEQDLDL